MDFAIRKDARKWFKDIRSDLDLDFDAFYFCFVAGVAAKRKKDIAAAETDSLVDNFPGPYRSRSRLLVSLFLSRELQFLGITMAEKRTIHSAIARLVDPEASNHLSDEGVREFNKYCHGGYEVLLEWFEYRPQSLETFLRTFNRRRDEVMPGLAA